MLYSLISLWSSITILRDLLSQKKGAGSNSLESLAKVGARGLACEKSGPWREIENRVYNPCLWESLSTQGWKGWRGVLGWDCPYTGMFHQLRTKILPLGVKAQHSAPSWSCAWFGDFLFLTAENLPSVRSGNVLSSKYGCNQQSLSWACDDNHSLSLWICNTRSDFFLLKAFEVCNCVHWLG